MTISMLLINERLWEDISTDGLSLMEERASYKKILRHPRKNCPAFQRLKASVTN